MDPIRPLNIKEHIGEILKNAPLNIIQNRAVRSLIKLKNTNTDIIKWADTINKIMHEYQKHNNITRECMTNAQYLLNFMKSNTKGADIKAVAIILTGSVGDIHTFVNHVVLTVNDKIFDPSYDNIYKKSQYYKTIGEFKRVCYPELRPETHEKTLKSISMNHLQITNAVHRMNNGDIALHDEKHYHAQANFVQNILEKSLEKLKIK